jgi:hypothetical protein
MRLSFLNNDVEKYISLIIIEGIRNRQFVADILICVKVIFI